MNKKVTKRLIQNSPDECILMIWNVPKELKHRFKVVCAKKNRPMRHVILDLMERYVETENND